MGLNRVKCVRCGRNMFVGNEYVGRDSKGQDSYGKDLRPGPFICGRKSCRRLE